ncbi:conserved exported hypothetical protein [uncultured delta proteobacterium]|uniref:FlgO domain-containing protein n=1 Tax=uncultured delta proteobacterium TaxID=34034 RepID=A0A212KDX2_9DELT|nr:conserved exported hypothetical protein [uncultured delta proteobacterium]
MHTRTTARPRVISLTALVAAFCGSLLILGAGNAVAKEYEVVNTPPPMPEAMKRAEKAPVIAAPQNAVPVGAGRKAYVNGEKVPVREAYDGDAGFAVPDTDGGLIWVPAPNKGVAPGQADARELKLKIRELADQLIANMHYTPQQTVALPTSFVNQEDFSQSSPLGRFIAEQMFYECNQRNFPVREYRMGSSITVREDGEFLLSRAPKSVSTQTAGTVFVVGTYLIDRQAVFVNARLLRGDGTVLRTAQVILSGTGMTRRMLAGSGKTLKAGSLPIRDFKTTTQPTNLTPFDQGEDVH